MFTSIFFSFAISSYNSLSFLESFFGILIFISINKSHFLSLSMCFTQSPEIFIISPLSVQALTSTFLFQMIGMFISFVVHKTA
ncbi:MAG: hypothetical protein LBD88_04725 [Candidatus Peribacteria bacterium]|nr:hypothetical protein [Candidatus Peribacteria bacterium]